jgi:hypothetical protein
MLLFLLEHMCNPLDQDKLLNWSAFQYADESLCLAALNQLVKYDHISLFLMPFPFFAIRLLRYLSVGRFSIPIPYILCLSLLQVVRRGSGALFPTTHAHFTSHSQTYITTFIHPWAPFPTGLEPVLTSRWWSK